jgi:methionyl-tRNA formyltransferase
MRFAFLGGTYRGLKLLEALIGQGHIPLYAVVMKEDEHEEEKVFENMSALLKANQVPHSIKRKLGEEENEKLKSLDLEFVVVFGWRTLIDTSINKHIRLGLIAAHHSLLPEYRGFAPTHWVLINGEKETGVTLFQINDGEVDSGLVLGQKRFPILFEDYAWDVYQKIITVTIELYLEFFDDYAQGKNTFSKQDESKATYGCKRLPEDGQINWAQSSLQVYNFIRALAFPFTGAFLYYNDVQYDVRKATIGMQNDKRFVGTVPGRVIKVYEDGIEVLCAEGTVMINEWQNKHTKVVECPSASIRSINTTFK